MKFSFGNAALLCLIFQINLPYSFSSESYQECDLTQFGYDPTLMETNYGPIKGACYQIPIDDPDRPNRTENVITWLAVPYAQPPINELRFRKPRPPKPWTYIRNATEWPNKCMQTNFKGLPPSKTTNISEDCLYLNIFAPAKLFRLGRHHSNGKKIHRHKAPIYIFIHGGGFNGGSSAEAVLDSSILVGLSDIIVVTINYRLGPFGFMHLNGSDISGNQGFLDQHMAIRWVHENAIRFGGNPNEITVGGFSAGSFSTGFHLIYEPGWRYFRNVIMQSGSVFYSTMNFLSSSEASRRARDILTSLGCDAASNSTDQSIFNLCIERLNAADILDACENYKNKYITNGIMATNELNPLFRLVIDGQEFKYKIKHYFQKGHFKIPNILSGHSSNESSFMIYFGGAFGPPTSNMSIRLNFTQFTNFFDSFYHYFPTYPKLSTISFKNKLIQEYLRDHTNQRNFLRPMIRMLTDECFVCPTLDLAKFYSRFTNVFVYNFKHKKASSIYPKRLGTVHGDDLSFSFGEPLIPIDKNSTTKKIPFTIEEKRLSKQVITYWTNFIKHNNPNIYDHHTRNNNYTFWPMFKPKFTLDLENQYFKFDENFVQLDFSYKLLEDYKTYDYYHMLFGKNRAIISNDYSYYNCKFWKRYNIYPKLKTKSSIDEIDTETTEPSQQN